MLVNDGRKSMVPVSGVNHARGGDLQVIDSFTLIVCFVYGRWRYGNFWNSAKRLKNNVANSDVTTALLSHLTWFGLISKFNRYIQWVNPIKPFNYTAVDFN